MEVKDRAASFTDAAQMTALVAKYLMEAVSSEDAPECKNQLEACNSIANTLICIYHDIVGTKNQMPPFLQTATTSIWSPTALMVMMMTVSKTTCHGVCSFHIHIFLKSLHQNYAMY